MIKVIIFDYDGVIVDSFQTVYEVYKIMCHELDVEHPKNIEEFKKLYGYNFIECYKNLGFKIKDYEKAGNIFKREILKKDPKIFAGIDKVLEILSKKYELILLTANLKKEAMQKLKKHGMLKFFSHVFGENADGRIKKSKIILSIIKKMNCKNDDIIMIGDRNVDYDASEEAGLRHAILVDYGWGHDKNNKQKIKNPLDILKVINNNLQ